MARKVLEPITPEIMKLAIWQELRRYITPQKDTSKPRGHFNMRALPETLEARAVKTYVKCGHPKCGLTMPCIRKHRNSKHWSIHVTGPGSRHEPCRYGSYIHAQILAIQLDIGQAQYSPRVIRAKEDSKQLRFRVKDTKTGPELVF